MAEYIEREAALRTAHIMHPEDNCLETELMKIPAADVAPVVHGRWERTKMTEARKGLPIYPRCSACGMVSAAYRSEWEGLRGAWKYCPSCGARMDGGEE